MTDSWINEEIKKLNLDGFTPESVEVLKEALKETQRIVEARRKIAEQEQSIQGAIVKLTSVIEELQTQFSAFKAQKNANVELEREVLGIIKSKLGE